MGTTIRLTALAAIAAVFLGCLSSPPPAPEETDVYPGSGSGAGLGEAMSAAKMDAVRNAVIDLIGRPAEADNAARLEEVLYGTRNPNAFVFNDTMETVSKSGSLIDEDMYYELRIRVDVAAVQRLLDANNIPARVASKASSESEPTTAGAGTGQAAEPQREQRDPETVDLTPMQGDWGEVTPREAQFIRRFVDTMTYMVYFPDDAAPGAKDPEFLMRSAVNQANGYLVSEGRLVVDADQVETIKEDQRLVYEEETGREISLLQWVARRLNADVYIELDARVTGTTRNGNHYGTAEVTLNMYDTSTAQILGSVNRRSQESFSRTDQQDAVMNAVLSTVYQAMPLAVDMSQTQMALALTRGIRYELTVQNPPDGRTLSRLRSEMRDEVREMQSISQSPEEAVYEVFAIGSTDDIVDLVYEVSDRVAGFENLVLVMSRGRSLTFDAGY